MPSEPFGTRGETKAITVSLFEGALCGVRHCISHLSLLLVIFWLDQPRRGNERAELLIRRDLGYVEKNDRLGSPTCLVFFKVHMEPTRYPCAISLWAPFPDSNGCFDHWQITDSVPDPYRPATLRDPRKRHHQHHHHHHHHHHQQDNPMLQIVWFC